MWIWIASGVIVWIVMFFITVFFGAKLDNRFPEKSNNADSQIGGIIAAFFFWPLALPIVMAYLLYLKVRQ